MNLNDDDLEQFVDGRGFSSRRKRLAHGNRLSASVWEIAPSSAQIPYHFHHAQEELVIVLSGRLTLRTPDGERELVEGDVLHFETGLSGAHALRNDTNEPVRVLWVSELAPIEVAEYPDSGKVRVTGRHDSQRGERLATQFRLADEVEYLDGE